MNKKFVYQFGNNKKVISSVIMLVFFFFIISLVMIFSLGLVKFEVFWVCLPQYKISMLG
jgi:hypothetical protein